MKDQLQKLSKEQAIEVAHRAQRARRNQEGKMAKLVTVALGGGLGVGLAGALGYWMGQAEYEYETAENKEAIDAGDEPDPRKWFGFEKDLVVSGLATAAGLLGMLSSKSEKGLKFAAGLATVGLGGLSGHVYGRAHLAGYKSMKEGEDEANA